MHGRMARGGHGLTKSVTRACHAQPHHALRVVTTETAVSEVAAHNAVFYPLGYPTSYAYSKTERVVFFFSLPYRTGLVVGGLKGLRVALSGSGWPQVGSGWPRGHR